MHPQEDAHIKKKRVGKACDSCRIKKTKCDGKKPCNRCILDNKICVFTEKKKLKEKNHPSGYIELLETRLDILTKSFEKLIELSQPHLQFIQDIMEEKKRQMSEVDDISSMEDDDYEGEGQGEDVVPINKVVSYLIQQKGLLRNIPMEWEEGAMIAANFNSSNMYKSAKLFAEHKARGSPSVNPNSPMVSPRMNATNPRVKRERHSTGEVSNHSFHLPVVDNSNLLNSTQQQESGSDFDSDSNTMPFMSSAPFRETQSPVNEFQQVHYRTASLFSNEAPILTKTASLSSLTNTYDGHSIASPPAAAAILSTSPIASPVYLNKPSPVPMTQRRRTYSNNGGVHKPQHQHHLYKSVDYSKRDSGSSTTSSMIATPNQTTTLFTPTDESGLNTFIEDKMFLNPQPVIIPSPPEMTFAPYQSFDLVVNEGNFDTFMSNDHQYPGRY
ncbi:uncharacterized protein SPAPADRAFT_62387 [Spathaspora passalidarum NRRL Y-27907]|uniref:Zn(2)-C6 fungal-type domain-containing protein n=1 Tax=Spathaspora passalidarum (strain NRRL Y-27907 / 11-Y1) TaxID=619300 RepID=G3ARP1_SPAPN|nr:uncharacterized protein SPAPADRAFT_62387 [Spathaspora passalidarum NRRL Y-27907]EGW31794.1 hypothetical protein SPAPADRAFT_62387 [Spathaspora passalidarum NRRL Y-27907]